MASNKNNIIFEKTSFLQGGNSPFIKELYLKYLENSKTVPQSWKEFFDGLGEDQESIQIINKQVIYMIATRKALAMKAQEQGLTVSENEIKKNITNSVLFQENGRFIGLENYKRRIKEVFNLSEESFEQILREEALNDKLKNFLFNYRISFCN